MGDRFASEWVIGFTGMRRYSPGTIAGQNTGGPTSIQGPNGFEAPFEDQQVITADSLGLIGVDLPAGVSAQQIVEMARDGVRQRSGAIFQLNEEDRLQCRWNPSAPDITTWDGGRGTDDIRIAWSESLPGQYRVRQSSVDRCVNRSLSGYGYEFQSVGGQGSDLSGSRGRANRAVGLERGNGPSNLATGYYVFYVWAEQTEPKRVYGRARVRVLDFREAAPAAQPDPPSTPSVNRPTVVAGDWTCETNQPFSTRPVTTDSSVEAPR